MRSSAPHASGLARNIEELNLTVRWIAFIEGAR
jgi:hypothetical protein